MIRLLWIPLAGTVAAFIVVMLAHEPREEEPGPAFPELPPTLPDIAPEAPVPDTATEPAKTPKKPPPKPPPPPAEHRLRLEKDGSLVDLDRPRTFADGAAVIAELVRDDVRDRIFLSNGADVEEAALNEIIEKLAAKFEVRKVYRAAEKEE